ncbi:Thrombospondin type 3 repeat-containing protein [Fontimonas thermophila]|uniref:Thrombospondin type 3 repeat-containing protein n=1 Tax=Fontimonas thermophila TaxID=1076937 RepID=A0A1I2IMI4_9GAMM|nr:OmpA family protein [Fontimonas thermophila]SFF42828.1 Thrombospondin type 3 repeat-containing protein [Fontimonas thermophila]
MSKHGRLGAIALLVCGAVSAQGSEFDDRFYLSPMVGGVISGSDDLDSGPFGGLVVGKGISPHFGLELEATYSKLDVSHLPEGNFYERLTLGANLVGYLAPDTARIRPFLLINGNGHDIDFLTVGLNGVGLGAGGGALFKLGERWDARLDIRYNLDFINGTTENGVTVPDDTFYLWTGALGVSYKFGANPYDEDGDGVPDAQDKCPGTPKGVTVYSDGCPTDLDQDGVPDYLDKCPNTPKGTLVGSDGCELDSDGDGVPDARDQCPNTPRGVPVNVNGCPLDSDGDGVPDYLDKCPGTPPGTRVNAEGCSLEDRDNDGIPDELDKCPGTPPGVPVGPDGCPLDSDGDGIPDYLDECPRTPPGAKVLPNGCALTGDCRKPRPGEQVDANGCAIEQSFILRGVKFEFDSDRLTPQAREILNEVAETLKAYPNIDVELEGHTDSIGTDSYNLGLSERRANAVKVYLEGRGVQGKRMRPVGYGESRPIASNDTEEGREENRRVELRVIE